MPLMEGFFFLSWQAQAENVNLLYSCHLRVSNEEDDIAQTGAPKQVKLVTPGVRFMIFRLCVTSFHWPKPTATVKLCSRQLLLQLEWVLLDIIIGTPRLTCQAVIVEL